MEGTLCFIDGLRPDRRQQRLARRYVMRGKNAGRKLSIPRRSGPAPQFHRIQKNDGDTPTASDIVTDQSILEDNHRNLVRLKSTASTNCGLHQPSLKTFPAPFEVSPSSIDVIGFYLTSTAERMYPAQLGISIEDAKQMYAQVLTSDEASKSWGGRRRRRRTI